jgi:predicted nucleic acid-binding Zn ribbon protein
LYLNLYSRSQSVWLFIWYMNTFDNWISISWSWSRSWNNGLFVFMIKTIWLKLWIEIMQQIKSKKCFEIRNKTEKRKKKKKIEMKVWNQILFLFLFLFQFELMNINNIILTVQLNYIYARSRYHIFMNFITKVYKENNNVSIESWSLKLKQEANKNYTYACVSIFLFLYYAIYVNVFYNNWKLIIWSQLENFFNECTQNTKKLTFFPILNWLF